MQPGLMCCKQWVACPVLTLGGGSSGWFFRFFTHWEVLELIRSLVTCVASDSDLLAGSNPYAVRVFYLVLITSALCRTLWCSPLPKEQKLCSYIRIKSHILTKHYSPIAGRSGNRIPMKVRFYAPVHTDPGVHSPSVGTVCLCLGSRAVSAWC
jgi:hypothetical protein